MIRSKVKGAVIICGLAIVVLWWAAGGASSRKEQASGTGSAGPGDEGGIPAAVTETVLGIPPVDPVAAARGSASSPESRVRSEESHQAELQFSGTLELADGTVPPELSFEIGAAGRDREELRVAVPSPGGCVPFAYGRSTETGQIHVTGLCRGQYWIRLVTLPALRPIKSLFEVPSEDVRIYVDGFIVRVKTVDADGGDLPQTVIRAVCTRDDAALPGARQIVYATSDRRGMATLCFPEPCLVEFQASNGLRHCAGSSVVLSGPSRTEDHKLVLADEYIGASLKVSIRDCLDHEFVISDYCINLHDAQTGRESARVCSEDEDAFGILRNLSPGRLTAKVSPRFVGQPVYYIIQSSPEPVPVVLVDGQQAQLELCVRTGGRVSLLVSGDASPSEGQPSVSVSARVVSSDGAVASELRFRQPDETGVTFLPALPLGSELLVDNVLAAGVYDLIVSAEGYITATRTFVIVRGETVHVAVKLARGV